MATSKPSRFPNVPYAQIRWLVGALHTGDSDAEVAGEIESRLRRMRLRGLRRAKVRGLSESSIREGVRYALAVHEDNRKIYRQVMRGF